MRWRKNPGRGELNGYRSIIDRFTSGTSEGELLSTEGELEAARSAANAFIKRRATDAGASEAVVAMSGGLDSALTAVLTAETLPANAFLVSDCVIRRIVTTGPPSARSRSGSCRSTPSKRAGSMRCSVVRKRLTTVTSTTPRRCCPAQARQDERHPGEEGEVAVENRVNYPGEGDDIHAPSF